MEAYLKHILSDIRNWPVLVKAGLEKRDEKSKALSFSDLLQYERCHFPASDQLSALDTRRLVRQFELFCKLNNIRLLWPIHLPYDEKYSLLLDSWNSVNIQIHDDETATVHFCSRHLSICSFGSKDCICGAKFKPYPWSHLGPAA